MKWTKYFLLISLILNFNFAFAEGGDVSGGGDSVEQDVEQRLSSIGNLIIEYRDLLSSEFDLDIYRLSAVAQKTIVINLKKEDLENDQYGKDFFVMQRNGQKRTVYAKNYQFPERMIFINNSLWTTLKSDSEKDYIVFHELLGAAGVEVNAYKYGNKIFSKLMSLEKQNQKVMKKITSSVGDLFSSQQVKALEQKYLSIRMDEASYQLDVESAIYLLEKKIAQKNIELAQIENELSNLEIRRSKIDACIEKLSVSEMSAYFNYQMGERGQAEIAVNEKVEACLQ